MFVALQMSWKSYSAWSCDRHHKPCCDCSHRFVVCTSVDYNCWVFHGRSHIASSLFLLDFPGIYPVLLCSDMHQPYQGININIEQLHKTQTYFVFCWIGCVVAVASNCIESCIPLVRTGASSECWLTTGCELLTVHPPWHRDTTRLTCWRSERWNEQNSAFRGIVQQKHQRHKTKIKKHGAWMWMKQTDPRTNG